MLCELGLLVKNLPAMQETQVWSLGWEDALEEGMATNSNTLGLRIPWTEEWQATVHIVAQSQAWLKQLSRSSCELILKVLYLQNNNVSI